MSEWSKGFEAGLKYKEKEREFVSQMQEWAACQSTVDLERYMEKISKAQQLIKAELDKYKEELKNENS